MKELVSIITPMFNSDRFIERTIQSVSCQTYKNWEMIIVDDASTDKSIDIVRAMAKDEKRIKLILSNENKGSAASRNRAIKASEGRYIAFLDSDIDIVHRIANSYGA